MGKIADIFRQHTDGYLREMGQVPSAHRKVIDDICGCRTPRSGYALYECSSWAHVHMTYLGCGNRHCPNCQHSKGQQWLERNLGKQLPGAYFMVTFTVPAEVRALFYREQAATYNALFAASADTLRAVLANEKYCGASLAGFVSVLHTWGRTLQYHPHIHVIIPGGGLNAQRSEWKSSHANYLAPVNVLTQLFRAKIRDELAACQLDRYVPPQLWTQGWQVNVQAVGSNARGALTYLAPYVFRVAIGDSRIVSVSDQSVTFRYTPSGQTRSRTLTLSVYDFMQRFLQHVLPRGFMKVRYYGFMSGGCSTPIESIRALAQAANSGACPVPLAAKDENAGESSEPRCPHCDGELVLFVLSKRGFTYFANNAIRGSPEAIGVR